MRHSRSVWTAVCVSLLAISTFPVYTMLVLSPQFERLLVANTKEEAIRLARSFSTVVVEEDQELRQDALPRSLLDRLARDGDLFKMRIFSPSGEIIYSSQPTEVGQVNREAYFVEIAEKATARAEFIAAPTRSLENEVMPADVVETYVPITRAGRVVGVFELYHDVSRQRKDLARLVYRSYGTLSVMTLGLLALVLGSSYWARRSMQEEARAAEELRRLSLTDELTGVANRRGFVALAEQQTRLAHRNGRPMMLISVDLDALKAINDAFGHQQGDAAIADAARILKESFRKSDLVGRIGGDEFAVLLTGGEAEFDQEKLDRRLREATERHNQAAGRPYRLSVSAGFAQLAAGGTERLEEWLHRADTTMYQRKREKSRPPLLALGVVALLGLSPMAARGGERLGTDIFAGYSFLHLTEIDRHGGAAAVAFDVGPVSLFVDASLQHGIDNRMGRDASTLMAGPGLRFGRRRGTVLFVRVLAGLVHDALHPPDGYGYVATDFGLMAGGGADVRLAGRWALRIQADGLWHDRDEAGVPVPVPVPGPWPPMPTSEPSAFGFRAGVGVVWRF